MKSVNQGLVVSVHDFCCCFTASLCGCRTILKIKYLKIPFIFLFKLKMFVVGEERGMSYAINQ
jgi:hypothetical protein